MGLAADLAFSPSRPLPDPDAEPEGGWSDEADKGLSAVQWEIISYLWSRTQWREYYFPARVPIDVPPLIGWSPNELYSDLTPSNRAALSRALRRLRDRGLVESYGYTNRTLSVSLTAEGRRAARRRLTYCERLGGREAISRRLTSKQYTDVNR